MDIAERVTLVFKKAKSGTVLVSLETKKSMKESSIKGEISSLENRLASLYTQIGQEAFVRCFDDVYQIEGMRKPMNAARKILNQIQIKKNELDSVTAQFEQEITTVKEAIKNGKTVCGNCGVWNAKEDAYCNKCGARLERIPKKVPGDVQRCLKCGSVNKMESEFCRACGAKLKSDGTQAETDKILCNKCGAENDPEDIFCFKCGAKLESSAVTLEPNIEEPEKEISDTADPDEKVLTEIICGKCGAENEPEDDFCIKCGAKLEAEGSMLKPIKGDPEGKSNEEISDTANPDENAPNAIICSKCETLNNPDNLFCIKCGAKLLEEAQKPAEAPAVSPEKKPDTADAKQCGKCGKLNDPDDMFCIQCGEKLKDIAADSNLCRNCGSIMPNELSFCTKCGNKL